MERDVDLDDLRADLRRQHDRLVDSRRIEKIDDDGNDKMIKEEKALKTGFKKQFKGKWRVCGKIGHKGIQEWKLWKTKTSTSIATCMRILTMTILMSMVKAKTISHMTWMVMTYQ